MDYALMRKEALRLESLLESLIEGLRHQEPLRVDNQHVRVYTSRSKVSPSCLSQPAAPTTHSEVAEIATSAETSFGGDTGGRVQLASRNGRCPREGAAAARVEELCAGPHAVSPPLTRRLPSSHTSLLYELLTAPNSR